MFERFGRYIPVVAAAIAIVAALTVLSRVVLTLDTIAHPGYQIAYIAGVVAMLGGFAAFAWLKLRRQRPKAVREQKRRAPPEARLDELFARHRLDDGPGSPRAHAGPGRRGGDPDTLTVALCGLGGTGKSALATALSDTAARVNPGQARAKALRVEVRELDSLDTDRGRNLDRLAPALAADVTLFVVDQDLRDYEQAAIAALARRDVKVVVAINKSDLMRAGALAETREAIAGKLAGLIGETDIVTVSAAPKPPPRLISDGDDVDEEGAAGAADVSAILERLAPIAEQRGRAGMSFSVAPAKG